jgi:hypothetical protein
VRLALVSLVALAVVGCGRADDRRTVSETTAGFLRAVDAQDGSAACGALSEDTAQAVASEEEKPCAEAVTGLSLTPSPVRRVQVFGIDAQVDLADGAIAFLQLTPVGWRLTAAGCHPSGGDQPYDCEVSD